MRDTCPKCGAPMRRHRNRHVGSFIERRRDCQCGYGDKVLVAPEKILTITPVVRRRTLPATQQHNQPLQLQHEDQNHV